MENLNSVQVIGMVWYKAEEYDACMRIMADRDKLPTRFVEWRMRAETGEKDLRRQGKTVIRVVIHPETFAHWCSDRGLNIDANARNQYAGWVAHQIATGGKNSAEIH